MSSPCALEPVLHSKEHHCSEQPVPRNEVQPPLAATRERLSLHKNPVWTINEKKNFFFLGFFFFFDLNLLFFFFFLILGYPLWRCIKVAQWQRIYLPIQETQETQVQCLSWEDPLEEEMATHSSILDGIIPWQRSLVGGKESGMTEWVSTRIPFMKGIIKELPLLSTLYVRDTF